MEKLKLVLFVLLICVVTVTCGEAIKSEKNVEQNYVVYILSENGKITSTFLTKGEVKFHGKIGYKFYAEAFKEEVYLSGGTVLIVPRDNKEKEVIK